MIRKLTEEDAEAMYRWMHDLDVTKYLKADFANFSMEKILSFIEKNKEAALTADELHYAVCDENGSYLGTVSLKNIDRENSNAEFAIVLGAEAHGKGYAKQAVIDILGVAFKELKLAKVYLYAGSDNIQANRFYSKLGFVKEGLFRRHMLIKGILKDVVWYGILSEEYPGLVKRIKEGVKK